MSFTKKINNYYSLDNVNKRMEDVIIHGSFIIFSKDYISRFDGIDDRTFMYMEEKLLFIRIKKNNLKSVYNPELIVFHKEDSATNSLNKTNRLKRLFLYKNAIKSLKIIIDELKEV